MTKSGTPARNHNYACVNSPIASAKRPRSSLERPVMSGNRPTNNVDTTTTPNTTTTPAKATPNASTLLSPAMAGTTLQAGMSPMHPPRPFHRDEEDADVVLEGDENADSASWVGRKVDALFSPVLSFLSAAKDEDAAAVTDEDATMEEPTKCEKSSDDDTTPTATTLACKDSSEEEDFEENDLQNLEEDPSSSFEEEEFNPYLFIKSLPPYRLVESLRPPITLPPKKEGAPKVSLVLDLDETLVHCTVEPTPDADLQFPVVFHGITYQVHVRLRPHLQEFLELIKNKFEVIVFTASQQVYANELLNLIDPGTYMHTYRESICR